MKEENWKWNEICLIMVGKTLSLIFEMKHLNRIKNKTKKKSIVLSNSIINNESRSNLMQMQNKKCKIMIHTLGKQIPIEFKIHRNNLLLQLLKKLFQKKIKV